MASDFGPGGSGKQEILCAFEQTREQLRER